MKKLIIILTLFALPAAVLGQETDIKKNPERPHWSFELKAGRFLPDLDNWSEYFNGRSAGIYGGSLAYKVTRQIEVGVSGGMVRASGMALAPLHSAQAGYRVYAGHVDYKLYPVDVFVLGRLVLNENQWLVPYAGGGWTRTFYREEVDYQGTSRGAVNGFHVRGGLQFLLDGLDPQAAASFYRDIGVFHTYLFAESEYSRVIADTKSGGTVNLGGTSFMGGLLFEF